MLEQRFLKHRVHRGSHFDYFLDRAYVQKNQVQVNYHAHEEQDGSVTSANQRYREAIQMRAIARIIETAGTTQTAAQEFHALAARFDHIEGFLHPLEGYAIYWLAKNWPGDGRVVEVGSFKGRSASWLATGCKEGRRGKLAAVDHFRGSPEHQPGGSHAAAELDAAGSTLPAFKKNLETLGLMDGVDVHAGVSADVSRDWREPIRLAFLDGDHSYESTAEDYLCWSPFVARHGLVVFHDVNVWPGVTRFYGQLCRDVKQWKEVGRIQSLGILLNLA